MPSVVKTDSSLATYTFFAKSLGTGDVFGTNGLPVRVYYLFFHRFWLSTFSLFTLQVLPHSISILGRSQYLKTLKHLNVCEFLETIRGKHERTVIVSEYRGTPLGSLQEQLTKNQILKIFYQIVSGKIEYNNF